jgi:arylsulfatase A-like enzyme
MAMFGFRAGILLLVLAATLTGCGRQAEEPVVDSPQLPPVRNLLLICIDTVRADTFYQLGALRKDSLSPWEAEGVVFKQAWATAPWTLPSVGSVFTGLWPVQHGIGQLPGKMKNATTSLPSDFYEGTQLFAVAAREAGFKTAAYTANGWTMSGWGKTGLVDGFSTNKRYKTNVQDMGETVWPQMLAASSELFIREVQEAPAFHFLHLMEAHNWHFMDLRHKEQMDERLAALTPGQYELYKSMAPEKACEDENSKFCRAFIIYVSAVSELREGVAQTLETLKSNGLLENTAVVLFSDHGEEFNDHRGDSRPESSPGKRLHMGHGHILYEELLRVPLIVWHPGVDGAVVERPVSLIDIAPTAARWLGVDFMPDQWQGRFLDDYILNPGQEIDRVIFASGINIGEPQIAVRKGSSKGIWYTLSDINQYFDLETDPLERESIASNDLIMLFDRYFLDYTQSSPHKTVQSTKLSPEQIKRLQSIGYLQGVETDGQGD